MKYFSYRFPGQTTTERQVAAIAIVFLLLLFFSLSSSAFTSASTLASTSASTSASIAETTLKQKSLLLDDKSIGAIDSYLIDYGLLFASESPLNKYLTSSANPIDALPNQSKSRWYKLSLENVNGEEKEWFIATALPQAPLLKVYRQSSDKIERIYYQDNNSGFYDRPYPHRMLVVPFTIKAHENINLYIQYNAIASYPIFPVLLNRTALTERTSLYELGNGIGLGALLVLFLFFFTQFLMKPSQSLGMYCMLVLSVGLFVCQLTGYTFKFLWPNHGEFGIRFSAVVGSFTYIWYFLFSSSLFNLKKKNSKLHSVVVFVASACALLTCLGLFIDISTFIAIFAMFALPVPVVVAVWALRNRLPSSIIFALGSSLHFSSAYVFILTCIGIDLGAHRHIFAIAGLGQLLDICLFAGALIYQSKIVRDDLNENLKKRVEDAETLAKLEIEKSQSLAKQQDYILQLAATTHDLKQPLAALKMALAVVNDNESKEAKAKMENTLNYTDQILRSLLDSSKEDYIDSVEKLDLKTLFNGIKFRYGPIAQKHNIQLRFRLSKNSINGSAIVLNRLLDNLVTNAIRHTSRGGVLVCARTRRNGVLIQVWDTGVGMPEENLRELTQPYRQAQKNINEGSGLGLFIVKTLCNSAGYLFRIESRQGQGTCISIFLPSLDC